VPIVIFMAALPLTEKGLDANLPAQTSTPPDDPALGPNQIVLDYSAAREVPVNH
jgi:biopolymer transport protein ExbD